MSNRSTLQEKLRNIVLAAKQMPCTDCGKTFPPICMDFDHLPGTKKAFNISSSWKHSSERRIREEITKCEVVCACCHRIRTEKRRPAPAWRKKTKTQLRERKIREIYSQREFSSMTEAVEFFNVSITSISLSCADGKERCGLRFEYADGEKRQKKGSPAR